MFSKCQTVNDIKKRYRQLCFVCHPDTGGTDEAMKELNRLYLEALARCNGQSIQDEEGKAHTYYYNQANEQEIMDMVYSLLKLKMKDVRIILVGYWLWISGDTRPYKEDLKALHCRWHSKRLMWYWHGKTYRHRYAENKDFGAICLDYGYKEYEYEERSVTVAG